MKPVRLFAALEPPAEARAALAGWGTQVAAAQPALRTVGPEALHVTLVFLGAHPAAEAAAIGRAVLGAARPLDALTVDGAAWLPSGRPGVLVADLSEPAGRLAALQAGLTAALTPWREPEVRPFRPHVTVARVRRGARITRREVPAPPAVRFAAEALALFGSVSEPGGSRYEALARVALG